MPKYNHKDITIIDEDAHMEIRRVKAPRFLKRAFAKKEELSEEEFERYLTTVSKRQLRYIRLFLREKYDGSDWVESYHADMARDLIRFDN